MENTTFNEKLGLTSQYMETCKSENHFTGLVQRINELFQQKVLCDIILVANDESVKIYAHKVILSSSSDYFKAMFDGSMREATEKEVKLQINGNILESIINYIYSATIEINMENVQDILINACYLDLVSLKKVCCEFVAKRLDLKNCVEILLLADQYNLSDLYEVAEKFVCDNFQNIQENEDLLNLEVDKLIRFLSSSNLRVNNEENVFDCLMSWINYDRLNRQDQMSKLLSHVRFPFLSPKFIASSIEPLCQSKECLRMVCTAFKWHFQLEDNLYTEYQEQLRNYKGMLFVISGLERKDKNLTIRLNYSNIILDKFLVPEIEPLSAPRLYAPMCVFQNKICVCGGLLLNRILTNRVDCLDMTTFKWSSLPSVKENRSPIGLAVLNGCLYTFCFNSRIPIVDKYDPEKETWTVVGKIDIESTDDAKFAVAWNRLWVVVRELNTKVLKIGSYDSDTDKWSIKAVRSYEYAIVGIAELSFSENELIIVTRNDIIYYNVMTNTCTLLPMENEDLKRCRKFQKFGERLIAFGENCFMEYEERSKQWNKLIECEEFNALISIN